MMAAVPVAMPFQAVAVPTVGIIATGFTEVIQQPSGKPHRLYIFSVSVGSVQDNAQVRYSTLRNLHDSLRLASAVGFPSKHIFRDMNKESNARLRSGELQRYLQALLNQVDITNAGAITMNPSVRAALGLVMGSPLDAELSRVGTLRLQAEQQRQQREAAEREAIRRKQIEDCDFAQRVNQMAPPGQPVTMLFPHSLTFELRNKMFSWRDQVTIKGPGGLDWFGMLRSSSAFSLLDTEVIASLSGEPLLALHRQFRWMHYEYRLERITAGMVQIPLCVITRQPQLFAPATYTIQMLAPSFGGMIHCQGRWLEDFMLFQDGQVACTVRRRGWSMTEVYDVIINPQRDVLLFLGIACAIDHIHHEIEKAEAASRR